MNAGEAFERRNDVAFLDVREWYEWDAGTIEGAVHIPIRQLRDQLEAVPRGKPVVVICQIGQRSALGAEFLNRNGFEAHNLEGGVEAWTAAGFPLVSTSGPEGTVVDGWAQTPEL